MRFGSLVRHYNKEARAGRMLPFVIRTERRLVGQMHLFGIAWGSLLSCAAGYWVAQEQAGHDIAPTALARAADYAMGELGLHRSRSTSVPRTSQASLWCASSASGTRASGRATSTSTVPGGTTAPSP